jgi:hypothetical protein
MINAHEGSIVCDNEALFAYMRAFEDKKGQIELF